MTVQASITSAVARPVIRLFIPALVRPVHIGLDNLHHTRRIGQRLESKLSIQAMRISGRQHESAPPLQARVCLDALQQPLAQSQASMRFEDVDIGQIREGGFVGDDSREAYLAVTEKQ